MSDSLLKPSRLRREMRLIEINYRKFLVIANLTPFTTNCGKVFENWMADFMWQDLERLIAEKCLKMADKYEWDLLKIKALKMTASTQHLNAKISFGVDNTDDCLVDALGVNTEDKLSVAQLCIYVKVDFVGDKNRLRNILSSLEALKDPEAAIPRTPTAKRPLSQLQNNCDLLSPPSRALLSPIKGDFAILAEANSSSKPIVLDKPPLKRKVEPKVEKTKSDTKVEKKKPKSIKEEKKSSKLTRAPKDKKQTDITKYLSPPSVKKHQEPVIVPIMNESSPIKKFKGKAWKDSPRWDSPFPATRKQELDVFNNSVESEVESENSPEEVKSEFDMYNSMRSPVKPSTPIRKHSKEEEILIPQLFPDPVDNKEFDADCKRMKDVFKDGDVESLHSDVIMRMFKVHISYLKAVHYGEIPSLARDEFQRSSRKHQAAQSADGGIILSYKNLEILTKSISKAIFKNGTEQNKNLQYTIAVLVPEFISRMMMSIYKVSKEDALKTIKKLSVEMSKMY